jgi:hypothetical protein
VTRFESAEALRRHYVQDKRRELVVDLRESLAGTDDAQLRQQLFDAAAEAAAALGGDQATLAELTTQLHTVTFGPPADPLVAGYRTQAIARHPELEALFSDIDAASDADRIQLVLLAVGSDRYSDDPDALRALLAADPMVDSRLNDGIDDTAAVDAQQAELNRSVADATTATDTESPAQKMLREHLQAAEAAEVATEAGLTSDA